MRIKEGDEADANKYSFVGKKATNQRTIPSGNRLVVSGVNIVKKHQKAQQTGGRAPAQGGIIEFEGAIDASKVMLVCPHTGELTRIGYRREEDGKRIRFSKKSGQDIE